MKLNGVVKTTVSGTLEDLINLGAEIIYNTEEERRKIISELEKMMFVRVDWNVYENQKNGKTAILYSGPRS